MQKLNLLEWRKLHGDEAFNALWARAGFTRSYLYVVMGGHGRMSITRARKISALAPDLDPLLIYDMHEQLKRKAAARKRKKEKLAPVRKTNEYASR